MLIGRMGGGFAAFSAAETCPSRPSRPAGLGLQTPFHPQVPDPIPCPKYRMFRAKNALRWLLPEACAA
jgi:hypothetical protein